MGSERPSHAAWCSRFVRPLVVAAVALPLLGWPPAASAQTPEAPDAGASADDRATARMLAEQADQKLEAGDVRGALELFQRADAIFPAPTLKLAAARAMVRLGQLIEAHELLLAIARTEIPRMAPAPWGAARDAARQEAAALAPRIPRVEVHLEGPGADASPVVLLDGRRIPSESLDVPRPINPGSHRLRAEAPGHRPAEQTIQMAEGELYRISLKLLAEAPATRASASASVGVRPVPTAPSVDSGSSSSALVPWVGFSVAGVGLLTGVVTGLIVRARVSDIKDQCDGNTCRPSLQDDADRARTLANVSNVSFVLAAVGAGVGLYGLLAGPSDPPPSPGKTTLRWRLDLGPGAAMVRGSF